MTPTIEEEVEQTEEVAATNGKPEIPEAPTPNCPAHVREHYDAICEKEREVRSLEGGYLSAKEEAAEAKKAFEAADKMLRNLISRGADPQQKLPFDEPAAVKYPKRIRIVRDIAESPSGRRAVKVGEEFDFVITNTDTGIVEIRVDNSDDRIELEAEEFEVIEWMEPVAHVTDNDAWRKAPLNELGLTEKQNDLFASAGVSTIGDIEDLRAKITDGKGEWPKGIGPAKVTDIENRIVSWLDKNRDKFGEPTGTVTCSDGTVVTGNASELTGFILDKVRDDFAKDSEPVAAIKAKANGKPRSNPKAGKRGGFAGKPKAKAKAKRK